MAAHPHLSQSPPTAYKDRSESIIKTIKMKLPGKRLLNSLNYAGVGTKITVRGNIQYTETQEMQVTGPA